MENTTQLVLICVFTILIVVLLALVIVKWKLPALLKRRRESQVEEKTFVDVSSVDAPKTCTNEDGLPCKPFGGDSACFYDTAIDMQRCMQDYLERHKKSGVDILSNLERSILKNKNVAEDQPTLLVTFGGSGAGKSTLGGAFLSKVLRMDPNSFVDAGVDEVLYLLPEYASAVSRGVVWKDAALSCYGIALPISNALNTRYAESGYNLIFGPTGRQAQSVRDIVNNTDGRFSKYRKVLLYIKTEEEQGVARAIQRGKETGRYADKKVWDASYTNIEESWGKIKVLALANGIPDVYEINNNSRIEVDVTHNETTTKLNLRN